MTTHDWPAWEVPVLLLTAFRSLVEEAHTLLAARGFPDARPVHGFTLQAIGEGATATEIGRRLGVTKQAAARTLALLEEAGYVERRSDPADARRAVVTRTARGTALLAASADAFAEVLAGWQERLGADGLDAIHAALRVVAGRSTVLDVGAWLS